jgi:hypothetical protein
VAIGTVRAVFAAGGLTSLGAGIEVQDRQAFTANHLIDYQKPRVSVRGAEVERTCPNLQPLVSEHPRI